MSGSEPAPGRDGDGSDSGVGGTSISRIPVKRFGDYNLIGRLGFGGMAEVFLAYTSGPSGVRKLVVIKRLHQHLRDTKDFVRMFLDEARLAARLNHPNVVQTYELGEIDGTYFMAMEYLQGQSLDRMMRLAARGEAERWPQFFSRVLGDALDGLHYAHELSDFDGSPLNIIHRDISPQNIFVTYEGTTKILDFGVAKAATQLDQTESGVLKGKCSYVAPEQAYGEPVDRRADLWAMGVVLWEGLVGRRLFKTETNASTLLEVLTADIPLVMDLSPEVSLTLGQTVQKALQRKPSNRYDTALEMSQDLKQYFREVAHPMTHEEAGELVCKWFSTVRKRQARVVEECLADALASSLPRTGQRSPKDFGMQQNLLEHVDGPPEEAEVRPLANARPAPAATSGRPPPAASSPPISAPEATPIPSPVASASGAFPASSGSLPAGSGADISGAFVPPPQQQQTTRQKLLFGLLVIFVAGLAAATVALAYQHFVLEQHGHTDEHGPAQTDRDTQSTRTSGP